MKYRYFADENITTLQHGSIFVFGSNLKGIHGKGAALIAKKYFGAEQNKGVGLHGKSYALPTKSTPYQTLSLECIKFEVEAFKDFATKNQKELEFVVTRVGCGLAGFDDSQIAPMFVGSPCNCIFHEKWMKYLETNPFI